MSENSNTSNVQLPGIINSILGQWADDIIERVNESVRFLGVTTTAITDGSTVSTIVIDGQSVSVSTGDIAVYSGNYFLFYSSAWHAGGGSSSVAAEDVSYDNTTSGLTATDVQDAVDEVVSGLSDKMDKVNPTGTGSLSLNRKANTTIGTNSVAVGVETTASGNYSVAEGADTTASGAQSHAEGTSTTASGDISHAEGISTTASGSCSHAEGSGTTASGAQAHTEGASTIASNNQAHAEGGGTTASGAQSHAEGGGTTASGSCSHAEGLYTIAAGSNQHAGGKYNIEDNNNAYAEIIGNGTYNARSNARTLDWSGNETLSGNIEASGFGTTLLNLIYPVGSIYISVNNVNPGTYLTGTTWVAWGSGKVPVGVSTDTEFNTVEKTGGGKTTPYTPSGSNTAVTLTAAQSGVPAHGHTMTQLKLMRSLIGGNAYGLVSGQGFSGDVIVAQNTQNNSAGAYSSSTISNNTAANASQSHNHTFTGTKANISTIQPYITCYMWKRTV